MHLIFDAYNVFIRAWAAYPQMSSHGYQMGGCIGTLKTLARLCDQFCPTHVYFVWESGGSKKRRKLYSEYKKNRGKGERLNRFYGDDIPESDENKVHQIKALTTMLKTVPVKQLYVPDTEGDDVIAYLCKGPLLSEKKIIVSSDKDMYQLLDDNTRIYNLYSKTLLSENDIAEQFLITASNFGVAKAIAGDVSDNIPGVKGVGFKTLAKKIDILRTHDDLLIEDVISFCDARRDDSKFYEKISKSRDVIERNWALIHLDVNALSLQQTKTINSLLVNPAPRGSKIDLMRLLVEEGINDFDMGKLFSSLSMARATSLSELEESE